MNRKYLCVCVKPLRFEVHVFSNSVHTLNNLYILEQMWLEVSSFIGTLSQVPESFPEPGSWKFSFSPNGTFQQWYHRGSSLFPSQTIYGPHGSIIQKITCFLFHKNKFPHFSSLKYMYQENIKCAQFYSGSEWIKCSLTNV